MALIVIFKQPKFSTHTHTHTNIWEGDEFPLSTYFWKRFVIDQTDKTPNRPSPFCFVHTTKILAFLRQNRPVSTRDETYNEAFIL